MEYASFVPVDEFHVATSTRSNVILSAWRGTPAADMLNMSLSVRVVKDHRILCHYLSG